jgi:outer membrane protein assembly factor BamB
MTHGRGVANHPDEGCPRPPGRVYFASIVRFSTIVIAVAAMLGAACGNSPSAPTTPGAAAGSASTGTTTPTSTPRPAALGPLPSKAGDDWTTFMGDPQRSGVGPALPAAGTPHRTWSANVDGDLYGSPLVAGSAVIAVTEQDSVYSLDTATGAVRWRAHLGQPVPLAKLLCGNIDPNGITSTPVIDTAAGMVYTVAMLDSPLRHELFALRLTDGSVAWHHSADPPGADPRIHQQRGALNLAGGYIYIAYGGFTGDCGQYHGWVVRAAADGSGGVTGWQAQSNSMAGVWAPPGPVISSSGDVWVSTGNSEVLIPDRTQWDGGNAVMRLTGDLSASTDNWVISNWAALNGSDTDLGSFSPALLPGGLVFASGKIGVGYLLRDTHLGSFGGEVFSDKACQIGGPTQGAFGGAAVAAGMVFVPCKDGLAALRVDTSVPSFTVAWHAAEGANSPVIAYGLVWTVAANPAGYRQDWQGDLVGLDPATGAERARIPLGPLPHFPSPAVSRGSLYVGGRQTVYAVSAT